MNPFNFIPAPYRLLGYAVASLALVGTAYLVVNKAYSWAYNNGVNAEKAMWESRESTELAEANKTILDLTANARLREADHAKALNDIANTYEDIRKNEKLKNDKTIADINAGVIRLRDKFSNTSGQKTCSSGTSETSTGSGERNGETGSDISSTSAEFLYELAVEADSVVEQLTACQAVVIEDRKLCGVK